MKQITFKDNFGKIKSVVFFDSASLESQMNEYLNLKPGCGYCVEFKPTIIAVLDCYTGETVGEFQIISIDYADDLSKQWICEGTGSIYEQRNRT